ncbi:MAG: hypothetical protein GTN38_02715 [Candidatus Aenigmarchaeota archaeon]|nr:hypothetical protein [Candidatus Aenigmarchaeota archaeon]NIP40549.1 hypothetical protein [Candidatus Aenigmarchaeota archaeon]NIQ18394.1 hypothetical protein [Candidatus Aenigmarchaeota archaeon]
MGYQAFTWKAVLVGVILSIVVCMYSAYAGLKVGGVYWPIITATIMSFALLKIFGGTNKNEVNVAATAASTGGLLAAGIIFTVPAIWLIGLDISVFDVTFIAIVGGLLGVLFTVPLRKEMIERLKLPYPDGTATAKVLEAGDEGGGKAKLVFSMFGLAGLFTIVRDYFQVFPSFFNLTSLKIGISKYLSFGSGITLVSFSGGFLIGLKFTGVWFAGAVVSYLAVAPALVGYGFFPDKFIAIMTVTKPFGIGVIIGASVIYFLVKGLPAFRPMLKNIGFRNTKWWFVLLIIFVALLSFVLKLNLAIAIVSIFGAFLVSYIAARITGEINIDPMEVFAMAILIIVLLFVQLDPIVAVTLAAILCISAGMAGDFMQDLKAGHLVKTRPRDQIKSQIISVFSSGIVIGIILLALDQMYKIGSVDLPAPQAVALSAIVSAGGISQYLILGAIAGGILTLISIYFKQGIVPIAFGIGLYAPIELSFPLFIGGLLRYYANRKGLTEKGQLIAAGFIGGEGFIGVILALLGLFMVI